MCNGVPPLPIQAWALCMATTREVEAHTNTCVLANSVRTHLSEFVRHHQSGKQNYTTGRAKKKMKNSQALGKGQWRFGLHCYRDFLLTPQYNVQRFTMVTCPIGKPDAMATLLDKTPYSWIFTLHGRLLQTWILGEIRSLIPPKVRTMALTATASM